MTRKNILRTCLVTFLLLSVSMVKVDAQQTKIYVNPKSSTISDIGDVFTINITVTDVNNFTGFEFKLYWDRTLLNVTDTAYTVPDPSWTNPFWIPYLYNEYNATHGLFWLGCLNTPTIPISGDFVLATLTFQVMSLGSCTLNLRDTTLSDPEGKEIPHDTINGEVTTPKPKIYVDPKSSTIPDIGDVFTIEITLTNVTNLFGFSYKLFWDLSLINATSYDTYVPSGWEFPNGFLVEDEIGMWTSELSPEKIGLGYHSYAYSNFEAAPFTGDLTLATYTFKVLSRGSCVLDIWDDKFVDNTTALIPHDTIDGEVTTLEQSDDSSEPFSLVNVAIVIVVAVSFVAALYYVKKKIL